MPFRSVAIVGAGPTAYAVALVMARAGVHVCLSRAHSGGSRGGAIREGLEARARALFPDASAAVLASIAVADAPPRDVDMLIELTADGLSTRAATLATMESRMSSGAVLAVHAPSAAVMQLAEPLERKDQFVGVRFAFAANTPEQVELTLLPETAPGVAVACRNFCNSLAVASTVQTAGQVRMAYREVRL